MIEICWSPDKGGGGQGPVSKPKPAPPSSRDWFNSNGISKSTKEMSGEPRKDGPDDGDNLG